MELNIDKEKARLTCLMANLDDEIICEQEVALPANCPPVNKVIYSSGRISDMQVTQDNDRLRIEIQLEIEALFNSSEKNNPVTVIWGPESKDPVRCISESAVSSLRKDDVVWAKPSMGTLQLTLLSNGKVKVYAKIGMKIKVFRNTEMEIITNVTGPDSGSAINANREEITIYSVSEIIGAKHSWETDLYLPGHMPEIAEILMKEAMIVDQSVTALDGRVSVKGMINLGLIYLSSDKDIDNMNVVYYAWSKEDGNALPFEFMLDLPECRNSSMIEANLELDRITCSITNHGLRVRITLKLRGLVYATKTLTITNDITSTGPEMIDMERKLAVYTNLIGKAEERITASKTISLPERYTKPEKIIDARVRPVNVKIHRDQDQVRISGDLAVTIFYLAEKEGQEYYLTCYESVPHDFEFTILADIPGSGEGQWEESNLGVFAIELRQDEAGSFDFNVGIAASVSLWNSRESMVISDAALVLPGEDSAQRPTFLYYVVQPGDTIWKVARRYNTTVESIVQANKIANPDMIAAGEKMLIPGYVAVKK